MEISDIWGIQPTSQGKKQSEYWIFGGSNPPPKVEGDDCLGELQEVLIQTGADAEIIFLLVNWVRSAPLIEQKLNGTVTCCL